MAGTPCSVCGLEAQIKCPGCARILYCCEDHKKEDAGQHKTNCKPYRIERNEKYGRYLVANRDIKQGEMLMRERPVVVGPRVDSLPACLECFTLLYPPVSRCPECQVTPLCPRCTHNSLDCGWYRGLSQELRDLCLRTNNQHVLPLKILLHLRSPDPGRFKEVLEMESHLEKRRGTGVWVSHHKNVVDFLKTLGVITNSSQDSDLVQQICGILDVNSFEVRGTAALAGMGMRLRGVYVEAALMAHDCITDRAMFAGAGHCGAGRDGDATPWCLCGSSADGTRLHHRVRGTAALAGMGMRLRGLYVEAALMAHDCITDRAMFAGAAYRGAGRDGDATPWGLCRSSADGTRLHHGLSNVRGTAALAGMGMRLRGVYVEAALMAHDCITNVHLSVDDHFVMAIRASVDIPEGQPILYNYTDPLQATIDRQKHLREGKYFSCSCRRCMDPTELGTMLGGLRCPRCRVGHVLACLESGEWTCNSCQRNFSPGLMAITSVVARDLLDDVDRTNPDQLENTLKSLSFTFAPTHSILIDVKQSIVAAYRDLEPTRGNLQRKVELCRELLPVLRLIEPGISRLRGITLYELHVALVTLAQEHGESQLLQEAEEILKEAVSLLLYEPTLSPEGELARQAMAELKSLKALVAKQQLKEEKKKKKTKNKK
ncbi:uncharacterized protein LOC124368041 [Homalodisca vitripennis]|uniref:uncharacterized protein LOC124368041 n=1 Tax=Homalodisca vitripennis TaxID=197043 RepID=UPI001EEBC05C|nr:uncharacterized protein LOC124368041 [Homalodisca vitripennis]